MSYIKISIVSIIMSRADIKINDDVSINIEKLEVAIRTDHYTKSDLKEIILNGGFPYLKQPCSKSEMAKHIMDNYKDVITKNISNSDTDSDDDTPLSPHKPCAVNPDDHSEDSKYSYPVILRKSFLLTQELEGLINTILCVLRFSLSRLNKPFKSFTIPNKKKFMETLGISVDCLLYAFYARLFERLDEFDTSFTEVSEEDIEPSLMKYINDLTIQFFKRRTRSKQLIGSTKDQEDVIYNKILKLVNETSSRYTPLIHVFLTPLENTETEMNVDDLYEKIPVPNILLYDLKIRHEEDPSPRPSPAPAPTPSPAPSPTPTPAPTPTPKPKPKL